MPSEATAEPPSSHAPRTDTSPPPPTSGVKVLFALAPVALTVLFVLAYATWKSPTSSASNFVGGALHIEAEDWVAVLLNGLPWVALLALGRGLLPAITVTVLNALSSAYLVANHIVLEHFAQELSPTEYHQWSNPLEQVYALVAVVVLFGVTELVWRHRKRGDARASGGRLVLSLAPVVLIALFALVQFAWRLPFRGAAHFLRNMPEVDAECFRGMQIDGELWVTLVSNGWPWTGLFVLGRGPGPALAMSAVNVLLCSFYVRSFVRGLSRGSEASAGVCQWLGSVGQVHAVFAVATLLAASVLVWRHRRTEILS